MKKMIVRTAVVLLLCAVSAAAQSYEFIDVAADKYGYAVAVPAEFSIDGAISDTTTWTALPGPPTDASEPSLTIWIGRVPVEPRDARRLFEIEKKSDMDTAGKPNAPIKELTVLSIVGGYGHWFKESDKADRAGMHRWIVKIFGNGEVYLLCFAGPYARFEVWGPVFERVIASFRLI